MARRSKTGGQSYDRTGQILGREAEGRFAIIVQRERTRIAKIRDDGTIDPDSEDLVATSDVVDVKPTYHVTVGQRGAVVIPSTLRRNGKFQEGCTLRIIEEADGQLKVVSLSRPSPSDDLDALLAGVTAENLHSEIEMGGPVGLESL